MRRPAKPANEPERLATLRALGVLDSEPEERFDRVTRLAQRMFDVPIAVVSLVDESRQWFKSVQGLDVRETPREVSFCGHAILEPDVLVVRDASQDERFQGNPLVLDEPSVRFYAGYPIKAVDGHVLGTLCLIDREPREFSDDERSMLRDLGAMVEHELAAIQLATQDELTGLANRRGFMMLAETTLGLCERMQRPALLLCFDLDEFKPINDEHGHAVGDQALREFAEHLRAVFRTSDVTARMGGDEFAVLLTGTQSADHPLQRLRQHIAQANQESGRLYALRYSVGTAALPADQKAGVADLLTAADIAMYAQKQGPGRGSEARP